MRRFLLLAMAITGIALCSQGYAQYPGCGDPCAPSQCSPFAAPCYDSCFDSCCNDCCGFEGWYIGGHIGYTLHDRVFVDRDAWVDNFGTDWALGTAFNTNDGVNVGAQTGYNWVCGCSSLFGLEADFSWADLERTRTYAPARDTVGTRLTLRDHLNWYGTLRARAGIVSENLLLYGTAGAAWACNDQRFEVEDPTSPPTESFRLRHTHWGIALGTGIEWIVCCNLSIKAEGLLIKFPERTRTEFSPNGPETVVFDFNNTLWVFRVGFNYKLCSFAGWFC